MPTLYFVAVSLRAAAEEVLSSVFESVGCREGTNDSALNNSLKLTACLNEPIPYPINPLSYVNLNMG